MYWSRLTARHPAHRRLFSLPLPSSACGICVRRAVSSDAPGMKNNRKKENSKILKKVLTNEVESDIITLVPRNGTTTERGYSSAGRALEWHSRGQRFDPAYLHHRKRNGGLPFFFCSETTHLILFQRKSNLCFYCHGLWPMAGALPSAMESVPYSPANQRFAACGDWAAA